MAIWVAVGLAVLALIGVGLSVGVRYGVATGPGRALLADLADGLPLGRVGTLRVQGLRGDLFRDFSVERLTIQDRYGVWLEARNVHIVWRARALARRRFEAERVSSAIVRVFRQPVLAPDDGRPDQPLPVSIKVDELELAVETFPALSVRRGVWAIAGQAEGSRDNAWRGQLAALSELRDGDGLTLGFRLGGGAFGVTADGREAAGGALAGLLGLAADQPFTLRARAQGDAEAGQVEVTTTSGTSLPAFATGGWTPAGGRVTGRVTLAASRLTQAFEAQLGPQLDVDLRLGPDREGVRQVALRAAAQNATLAADGPFNLQARTTPGLQVLATVRDLRRIVPQPLMGGGRLEGRFSGGLTEWAFAGVAAVDRLDTGGGYTLARVAGPIRVAQSPQGLALAGQLRGAGGRGQGLAAAWLGGAPAANFDINLLSDGRLLVRELTAAGPGLRLTARGERGLLGGLSFRGELALSNLAAAQPGARGRLTADWSAAQDRADRPWRFTLDAQGGQLASGLAQLDGLLGPTPRLRVRGEWQERTIRLAEARLDAARFNASASGPVNLDGPLNLAVDWRAQGPFAAGPVEVAGAVTGDGRITGTIAQPAAELNAQLAAVDLPQLSLAPVSLRVTAAPAEGGYRGQLSVEGGSAYGPARLNTAFAFAGDGIDLTGLQLDAAGVRAAGDVSLRNGTPSLADLTVSAGPGAFLQAGTAEGRLRMTGGGGDPLVDLTLRGQGLVARGANLPIRSVSLTARGPLSRLPFTAEVAGEAPIAYAFNGRGLLAEAGAGRVLTLEGSGEAREIAFRTLSPLTARLAGADRSLQARLAVGGGEATLEARQTADTAALRATLAGVDLGVASEELAGRLAGTVSLQGRGSALSGTADITLDDARNRDAPGNLALDGRVRASLAGERLSIEASATNAAGLRANATAVLPVEASAAPLRMAVARTRPLTGRFDAEGELQPLWDVFFGGERSLRGHLVAQGTLGGSLNNPRVQGTAQVDRGRFEDATIGLVLQNVSLSTELNGDSFFVRRFTGQDGERGQVNGAGEVSLRRGGGGSFRLTLQRFQIFDTDQGSATASGEATVTRGGDGALALRGALVVDRAEIVPDAPQPTGVVAMDVVERNVPAGVGARRRAPAARGPGVTLDVTIDAPRGVFVRGLGLDIELSVDARVGGTTNAPQLSGTARVVRGDFDFAGKRFIFDQRSVVYLDETPRNIRLNLTAVREDPTLTARVQVRGTAEEPEIVLTSTPRLPQDEVLAQVLFGRSASQLPPLEAAQLASSLSALATGGGFDVIGGLRNFAGLDRLTFAGGGDAGVSVAGGRYLTDDVYLEIIGGGREGPQAQVEWRVRRNLSILSRLGGEQGARLSVRWRREF